MITPASSLLVADIVDRFVFFLWPMIRISALLMIAPVLSINAVTVRIRVVLAFALTWLIYPLVEWPALDPTTPAGLLEVFNQVAIGALMGLMLQVAMAAVVVGGHAIAASMGLAMANMMDPNLGNVPVISQFLVIMASLIFLGLGGHALLLQLLLESFHLLPIGQSLLSLDAMGHLIAWSSMMFIGGVLLSLPILVILLTVNLGLGVVTRAAPTLNIFAVGFPAMIIAGFLILYAGMNSIAARIQWLWMSAFEQIRMILGLQ
ncbi:MAG: flagellar biosynthetic protein FliR [Burkholderiaceae bacterium]